jgi:hypothetical protein
MADTLVERLTGQVSATDVPVEIDLIMTDRALFGDGTDPARVAGEPVPAPIARHLALGNEDGTAPRWLRRLYRSPATGELIAMESRRRCFTAGQRRFIRARDVTCRTPYCDAPIRHADHVVPHDCGGPTDVANGQGLCAACNWAKEAPGWRSETGPESGGGLRVLVITPTGHEYLSRAPDPPGSTDPGDPREVVWIRVRQRLAELLGAA